MRISVFVIEIVRTLNDLYNVRCSVRTVLVRSRNRESRYRIQDQPTMLDKRKARMLRRWVGPIILRCGLWSEAHSASVVPLLVNEILSAPVSRINDNAPFEKYCVFPLLSVLLMVWISSCGSEGLPTGGSLRITVYVKRCTGFVLFLIYSPFESVMFFAWWP